MTGTEDGRAEGDARERHIEVPRTARYLVLGPEGGKGVREVWFVLHGYRQLARRLLRRCVRLDDGTRLVVAPEALSRFYVEREVGRHGPDSVVGASWMTRDDREREIADYVGYLDRLGERVFGRVERGAVRLTVLGFSQGVATAARWAVLGAWPPDRLVLWGDTLPPDLPEARAAERLAGLELISVRGASDPARRPEAEASEAERLAAWGVERRIVTWEGGHEVEPEVLEGIAAGR